MNPNEKRTRYDRVLEGAATLTHRQGWFTMPELSEELGSPPFRLSPSQGPVRDALEKGDLAVLPAGTATQYAAVLPTNLAEILNRAAECCDNAKADRSRGSRKGASGALGSDWREVRWLSDTQLSRAWTAARRVAEHLDSKRDPVEVLAEVSSRDLVWSPTGGQRSRGSWTRMERLVEAAASGCATNTVQGYKGALANVLFLAATRGWLPRPDLDRRSFEPIPPSWSSTWTKWRNAMATDDALEHHGVPSSLRLLFRGLLDAGFSEPTLTRQEWQEAFPDLEEFLKRTGATPSARGSVRALQRRLVELGVIDAPLWDGREWQNAGVGILPNRLIRKIAAAYGAERDWDLATSDRKAIWTTFPQSLAGLAHPTYGLPAVLAYYCVPYGDSASYGVASRGVQIHSGWHQSGKTAGLARGTLMGYLSAFGHLLGLFAEHWDVDWATHDLRSVCDPDRLLYLYHRVVRGEIPISRRRFQDALRVVGRIAPSVIVYAAKEELPLARESQDPPNVEDLENLIEAATRTAEIIASRQFVRLGSENPQEGLLHREGRTRAEERLRRMARSVERVWTAPCQNGKSFKLAFAALAVARRRVEAQTLSDLRASSWSDLVSKIQAGDTLSVPAAIRIRDCLMVGILPVAPLRRAALAALRHSWIRTDGGGVTLRVRSYALKNGGPDSVDVPDTALEADWEDFNLAEDSDGAKQILDPDLIRAYTMTGGGREILERKIRMETPYLWVPSRWDVDDPPAGEDKLSPRLQPSAVTRRVARFCIRAARVLGLDPASVSQLHPVHQFRHAFGTFFVAKERLLLAQQCLGHASLDFTVKVYSDMSAGRFFPGRDAAELLEDDRIG